MVRASKPAPQEEVLEGLESLLPVTAVRDREPGRVARGRKAAETKPGQVKWAKLPVRKTDRAAPKCDQCVGAMVRGGRMMAPDPAVYSRTVDGIKELLCWEHTSVQRSIDGLSEFKRPGR